MMKNYSNNLVLKGTESPDSGAFDVEAEPVESSLKAPTSTPKHFFNLLRYGWANNWFVRLNET